MIPIHHTIAAAGATVDTAIPMDVNKCPFHVGIGVDISATATYTVQYSFDNNKWFDHPLLTAKTADADGNIAFPVAYVRINIAANTGTVKLSVIQAG